MNNSLQTSRALAEAGCRAGRPSAAPAPSSLVIENLSEFASAGVVGTCGLSIADFIIRESRPLAAA